MPHRGCHIVTGGGQVLKKRLAERRFSVVALASGRCSRNIEPATTPDLSVSEREVCPTGAVT